MADAIDVRRQFFSIQKMAGLRNQMLTVRDNVRHMADLSVIHRDTLD